MTPPLRLAFIDDLGLAEAERLLGQLHPAEDGFHSLEGMNVEVIVFSDPTDFVDRLSREVHLVDAVLLDMDFSQLAMQTGRLLDSDSGVERRGLDVLVTVKRIDPDLPVILLTAVEDPKAWFLSGRSAANDFIPKEDVAAPPDDPAAQRHATKHMLARVAMALAQCQRQGTYDHEHLATADQFAASYDDEELSRPATVAYLHFEDQLIRRSVDALLGARGNRESKIRILDVGCGTGRIEVGLAQHPQRGEIEVVALDFSGEMLVKAEAKLAHLDGIATVDLGVRSHQGPSPEGLTVTLLRAAAERLDFLATAASAPFDMVIFGFGLLSYVRYSDVLPRDEGGAPLPFLKPGGTVLYSVYNERSAAYRVADLKLLPSYEVPMAALMDLQAGRLEVGGTRSFICEAFERSRLARFLRQGGLSVAETDITAFPLLHLSIPNSRGARFEAHPYLRPGRFDAGLFAADVAMSAALPNDGHYLVGVARKPDSTGGPRPSE